MGKIAPLAPVKLFFGVLSSLTETVPEAVGALKERYGPLDLEAGPFAFTETAYYDEQMGSPIERFFFGFRDLIHAEEIARIKTESNELEAFFAAGFPQVPRPLNLDPGYLEESKIVLASTKNFYHRIPLRDGIYAEVTMHFEKGAWRPFPWTFPDFRSGRYDVFFLELRRIYRGQRKSG